MPKKPLNVLSIDFDFFQKADANVLRYYYPDGHDFPTEISNYIWASHYAVPKTKDALDTVRCDTGHLDELLDILNKNEDPHLPAFICNSHKHAYDFITSHFDPEAHDGINLINIDMHHDCFNNNAKLDCGNWIKHLMDFCPDTRLTWITQPVALEVYDITDMAGIIETDFSKLKEFDFDLLFLCRSDIWLIPYFDFYFDMLVYAISQMTDNGVIEDAVREPRNIEDLIRTITSERKKAYEPTT